MLTIETIQSAATQPKERQIALHRELAETIAARGGLKPYFEFRGRQECIRKAMAKPLPGNSADAFLNGCLKVNGRTIYEVVPVHIKCLQAVESPLLKMAEKAGSETEIKQDIQEEDEWNLCYIFTTPPRELRAQLKNGGGKAIASAAQSQCEYVAAMGDYPARGWTAAEINITCAAVMNQYARHFQTTVKFAAEMEKSGDTTFFQDAIQRQ